MSTRCISRKLNGLVNDRTMMHESERVNRHVSNAILYLGSEQTLITPTVGSIFFDRLKRTDLNEILLSESNFIEMVNRE